jgi:hypothetical protein
MDSNTQNMYIPSSDTNVLLEEFFSKNINIEKKEDHWDTGKSSKYYIIKKTSDKWILRPEIVEFFKLV